MGVHGSRQRLLAGCTCVEAGLPVSEADLDQRAVERALSYYQGEFLGGSYLAGAPEWEDGVRLKRQHLRESYQRGLLYLAQTQAGKKNYTRRFNGLRSYWIRNRGVEMPSGC